MKNKIKRFGFIFWAVFAFCVLMVISIFFYCIADSFISEEASIIGGALSAIATALLGAIAIWQNLRYKKIADQVNDIQIRPEFFVTYFPTYEDEYYNLPALTIYPSRMHCQEDGPQDELLCCCKVLNYPVVKARPKRLFYYIDNQPADNYGEFEEQSVQNLILEKDQIFRIFIKKYVTLCDLYLEVEFENIYGDIYLKVIEFIAPSKNKVPEASIFGKFASGTIRMKPAVKQTT